MMRRVFLRQRRGDQRAEAGAMRSQMAAEPPTADTDEEAYAVHAWRRAQLTRLGLAWPVADAVADTVDWHEVARLVQLGCPPSLAVTIVE
jgi:hypothetical protein